MTKGKLLLTGSNGLLGKNIDIELTTKFHVCGLSRTSGKYIVNLGDDIPEFNEQFALVIHAAGKSHANLMGTEHSDDFHKVNVRGTQNLLKGLERIEPPKAFIFISSVAVYGINEGNCIDESSPLLAKDLYGRSKIQAEHLILNWCRENNVTCTILRLPILAGLNPPGNLGAMINGIKKGFYFNIAGGSAKKSMVLVRDVAKFLLKASEVGGIYNLTDGYHPSFFELSYSLTSQLGRSRPKNIPLWIAKMFALGGDLIGVKAPLNSSKLKKITATLTFDDSRARENFGWDPTPILEGFSISDTNK